MPPRADAEAPLDALEIGEVEPGETPADWVDVEVRAAALNHHDVWSLRGVGLACRSAADDLGLRRRGGDGGRAGGDRLPGDHRSGLRRVWIRPSIPARSLLSERYPGTLADSVRVPARNLIDKPAELSFAEAACLPTAWLTAYRMLFGAAGLPRGRRCWCRAPAGEWPPRW